MSPRLACIGLVAADLPATLAFYRRPGLDIPDDADSTVHVEVVLPGDLRLLIDPVSTVTSFNPSFDPARDLGGSSLAFACADPAEVDRVHAGVGAGRFALGDRGAHGVDDDSVSHGNLRGNG